LLRADQTEAPSASPLHVYSMISLPPRLAALRGDLADRPTATPATNGAPAEAGPQAVAC
jgi:hypothetical protein